MQISSINQRDIPNKIFMYPNNIGETIGDFENTLKLGKYNWFYLC